MNTNLDVAPNVVPDGGRVNILLNNHCCSTLITTCFVKLNWQFTSDIFCQQFMYIISWHEECVGVGIKLIKCSSLNVSFGRIVMMILFH